jgi:hypothetical protein
MELYFKYSIQVSNSFLTTQCLDLYIEKKDVELEHSLLFVDLEMFPKITLSFETLATHMAFMR